MWHYIVLSASPLHHDTSMGSLVAAGSAQIAAEASHYHPHAPAPQSAQVASKSRGGRRSLKRKNGDRDSELLLGMRGLA